MLCILSPAKTLDLGPQKKTRKLTQPEFLDEAEMLVHKLRKVSRRALGKLFAVSPELAQLNHDRFANWQRPFTQSNSKQAVLTFDGEVYSGLNAATFSARDLAFAQDHLRILSGLYGVLRPLDLMQAYRLEMGTALATRRGTTLYDFWGDKISAALNAAIAASGSSVLVNLASNEYFKAVRPKLLEAQIVTPVFLEVKNGKSRTIATFAKQARGSLARWIVDNRANSPERLVEYDERGYRFQARQSSDTRLVFSRDQPPPPRG